MHHLSPHERPDRFSFRTPRVRVCKTGGIRSEVRMYALEMCCSLAAHDEKLQRRYAQPYTSEDDG
jgi:hypothetical protein